MSHRPNSARRQHIKRQLAARDGAACFYCATPFADLADATIDHLIPHSRIPTWAQANLVLACGPCNHAKADRLPQEFLRPVGFRPGLVPGRARRVRYRVAALVSGHWPPIVRTAANVPRGHIERDQGGHPAKSVDVTPVRSRAFRPLLVRLVAAVLAVLVSGTVHR